MIRKTAFLLLLLTGLIPVACCPELPTGPYKVELSHVSPTTSDYMRPAAVPASSYYLTPDDTYHGDTLLLDLRFYSLLAQQSSPVSLHASAFATSCGEYPNFTHLQDKITAVEVSSNQPFQEIAAGEPLTEKVSVYHVKTRQITSLAQAITNMNTLEFYDGMEMGLGSLVLPGKPAELAIRTFTVRVTHESGIEQTVTSIPIRW